MRFTRIAFILPTLVAMLAIRSLAAPFVLFPAAGRLLSPDGRFEVRDAERQGAASDFVGTFHALWLIETSTGRSRKVCDYLGVAAVGWSSNDFLVITQYVGKKTSRAVVVEATGAVAPVLLDTSTLVQMVPVEMRPMLRENDHAFVEASRIDSEKFYFQVWGYGQHDRSGFHWDCEYALADGKASCAVRDKK